MNRLFLAILVLATAFEFHARELSPDEALQRVQGSSTRMNAPRRIAASTPKLVYTVKSTLNGRDATAYLFANSGKDNGYLLLSAEDSFEPILGYSDTGTISNPDDMPENFKWWLSEIGREADYAIRHKAVLKTSTNFGPAIEPLLKSKWGQDSPYNTFTPEIDGQHAPTGCLATAMAQIMYYYQWPSKPQGSHSYEWNGQTLSISYDELQFDWDKMKATNGDDSSQESNDAVAILMKAVGYSVDMKYAPWGSASHTSIACQAFKDYFKYNEKAICLDRGCTDLNDWAQGIYSNLSCGMPILYSGSNKYGAGHAFVCDGYDGNGYFHFNWGSNGNWDGYYPISYLNPSIGDYPYSYNQQIVLNLYPDNGHTYNCYLFLRGYLGVFPQGIYDEEENFIGNISYWLYNPCGISDIELGLGLEARNDGGLKFFSLGKWDDNGVIEKVAVVDNLLENLDKNKEYGCQLFWRNNQKESWTKVMPTSSGRLYVYSLKYSNDHWQYEKDLNQSDSRLTITNVIVNSDNVISNAINNEISFEALNSTDMHVNTRYKVVLENSKHFDDFFNPDYLYSEISLKPGESKKYIIDNIPPLEPGNYKMHILDFESGHSFYNSGNDSIRVVQCHEIKVDGLIYVVRPDGNLFIKGTTTGYPVEKRSEIYLPAELTVDSQKYKVVDVNLTNIVDKWSECSLIIDTPIEEIKENQFFDFPNLKKVRLPQTLKRISESAFAACTGLSEINLPKGLKEIKRQAFLSCKNLKGDLIIPDSVIEIGESAFAYCSGFDGRLVLGKSLECIDEYAFSRCSGLAGELVISSTVKTIRSGAFSYCSGFRGNLIIDGNTSFEGSVFKGDNFDNLIIGDSVIEICSSMFSGCNFNGSLKLGKSISKIGSFAFVGAKGLKGDLIIPDSVTEIGTWAFANCTSFDGRLVLGKSLERIGSGAFECCSRLTGDLVIPSTVKFIGMDAFSYCSGFNGDLIIEGDFSINDKMPFEVYVFQNNNFGNLIIGDSVTEIRDRMFEKCNFNGSLKLGKSISKIGSRAFFNAKGLKGDLIIPDAVTEIGENAFAYCSGFDGRLVLGKSLERIDEYAFRDCTGLSSVTISSSVTEIGEFAFANCIGMEKVYYDALEPITASGNVFSDYAKPTLYVPAAAMDKIRSTSPWKYFEKIEEYEFSGIHGVKIDDSGIDYLTGYQVYNLNGLKVGDSLEGLAPGLYIIRQGSKVEKVMVR